MKNRLILSIWIFSAPGAFGQITDPKATEVWEPVPPVRTAGFGTAPPSDAVVLFDGGGLEEWISGKPGTDPSWTVEGEAVTVRPGAGDIVSRRSFGDVQLHLEFRCPVVVKGEGQGRGNSGVFFQDRYEVQVLDCFGNATYPNGQTGAIYKQHGPLVNVCRMPGEWQTYDIIFTAPRFNGDGIKIASGFITVLHNGVLIQNHVEIKGTTEYIGLPKNMAHGAGPIRLQDHGDLVSYRNIWVREL
jgi:hypothetical protein